MVPANGKRADGPPRLVRRRSPSERVGTVLSTVVLAICGLAALAIGLSWLVHPTQDVFPGAPHRSDLPGMLGVGFLVVPVFLLGLACYRMWWTFELDLEARRERRRKVRDQT